MALRKEDLLFKKVFAKKSITEAAADRPFFSEPYTAALSLTSPDIWTETDKLPLVAPVEWVSSAAYSIGDIVIYTTDSSNALNLCYKAKTAHSGVSTNPSSDGTNWEVFSQLKWASTITMAAVAGAPYSFQDNDLKDTVPFSFGTSGYGYTFKKSGGTQISFGEKNWTFDTEAGAVYFHDDSLPSSINTPSMTCFVYKGGKLNTKLTIGDPASTQTTFTDGLIDRGSSNITITAGTTIIGGNLQVDGTTTTINSTTLSVDDKNIELGSVASPTDSTADGGGITLIGASDKTIIWTDSSDSWHYNQGVRLLTTSPLSFRDSALKIYSSADGKLDIDADGEVEIDTALLDVNATSLAMYGTDGSISFTTLLSLVSTTEIQMDTALLDVNAPTVTIVSSTKVDITTTLFEVNTDTFDAVSNVINFGTSGAADVAVAFKTNNSNGLFTWDKDLDLFLFDDDIRMGGTEKIEFGSAKVWMGNTASNFSIRDDNPGGHSIYLFSDSNSNTSNCPAYIKIGEGSKPEQIDIGAHSIELHHDRDDGAVYLHEKVDLHDVMHSSASTTADDVDYGLIEDIDSSTYTDNNPRDNAHTYAMSVHGLISPDIYEFNSNADEAVWVGASTIACHMNMRGSTYTNKGMSNLLIEDTPDLNIFPAAATPNISDCLFNYSTVGFTTQIKMIPRQMTSENNVNNKSHGEYGYWRDGGLH